MRVLGVIMLAITMVLGVAGPAAAQVNVQFQSGPGTQFAQQAGIALPTLQKQMNDELNTLFQTYRVGDYLRSFGDAQSFATRGMGVDYASNFKAVMVGVGRQPVVERREGLFARGHPHQAASGRRGPQRHDHGRGEPGRAGHRPGQHLRQLLQATGDPRTISRRTSATSGCTLQLKLFGPGDGGLMDAVIQWGGLDITTGFERSKLGMTLSQGWRRNIPVGMAGAAGAGAPVIDLNTTGAVPAERPHPVRAAGADHEPPAAVLAERVRRARLRLATGRRQRHDRRPGRHDDGGGPARGWPADMRVDLGTAADRRHRRRWIPAPAGCAGCWALR